MREDIYSGKFNDALIENAAALVIKILSRLLAGLKMVRGEVDAPRRA